jgi:hypothetical protein
MLNMVQISPKTPGVTSPLTPQSCPTVYASPVTVNMCNLSVGRSVCTRSHYTKLVMAVCVTVPGNQQAV